MTATKHTCKFCNREITLKIAKGAEDQFDLEWWKAKATCNPCADFHNRRLDLRDSIVEQIERLLRIRLKTAIKQLVEAEFEDVEKKSQQDTSGMAIATEGIRRRLNYLTRCYAKRICDKENHVFSWEPSFVDAIMKKPEVTILYLDEYFKNFAPVTHAQWTSARAKDGKMRAPSGDSSGTSRR